MTISYSWRTSVSCRSSSSQCLQQLSWDLLGSIFVSVWVSFVVQWSGPIYAFMVSLKLSPRLL
ncbi:hypothetical protein SCLCIDRAFT_1211739 [Scleroderma citrinum Foug A]|uniref:Uncharacterized protein n=1 Tax=Scleroderma citrinum Foug A TaxID=1036808 RepID=A0A0C3DYY3_9AGAM|nr:hypothetical protein SCLCIDRAFT_1211739 [Scleroderma citrinum Foug A]